MLKVKTRIIAIFIAPIMFGCQLTENSLQDITKHTNNAMDAIHGKGTKYKFNEGVISNINKTKSGVLDVVKNMPTKWENSDKDGFRKKLWDLERTTPAIYLEEEQDGLFPVNYTGSVCYPDEKNTTECLSTIDSFMKEIKELTGEDITDGISRSGTYLYFEPSKLAVNAIKLRSDELSKKYEVARDKARAQKAAVDARKKKLAQEKIHNQKIKRYETMVKPFQEDTGLNDDELINFCFMLKYEKDTEAYKHQEAIYMNLRQLHYEQYGMRKFQPELDNHIEKLKNRHDKTHAKLTPTQQSGIKELCISAFYGIAYR